MSFPPAVQIVQDGNRSLWIAGTMSLGRILGRGGQATKVVDFGTEIDTGQLPVKYAAEQLGRVDDYERVHDEPALWLEAQLDKRRKYVQTIQDLIERGAIAFDPAFANGWLADQVARFGRPWELQRVPLADVGLVHRGIQFARPAETLEQLKAVGTTLSPEGRRAIERAALREELGRFESERSRRG